MYNIKKTKTSTLRHIVAGLSFVACLSLGLLTPLHGNEALSSSSGSTYIIEAPSATVQLQAARDIIKRRCPTLADKFQLAMIPKENELNVFEVESVQGKIVVRGSSGVALAQGWYWYLKHVCHRHMSWCGSRMNLTEAELKPVPNGKFRQVVPHKHIAYMNYCTLSYSMPWWDWERWEWETDFMAMNGVNMPLGVVGIEAVWYNALLRVGLSDKEARAFLSGPAYSAWQWMQNIEGQCGPLPKSWIDSHIVLGKKILQQQRALGMTPIQQGFSGHVPRIFIEKFPKAKIHLQPGWCLFPGVAQLEPLDPFFAEFGKIFMEEEGKLFGLGGYYAADPFHESQPPKDIKKEDLPKYLDEVGKSIHEIFNRIDPKSVWCMQSWSIRKEIACAAPKGRLLILDLGGGKWSQTEGFWGHDFTTGQLHNFGARTEFHGDMSNFAKNNLLAAIKKYPETASGTGLFMEGILQNPMVYDLIFDLWWRNEPVQLDSWLGGYVLRRYGVAEGPSLQAWDIMVKKGLYRPGSPGMEMGSMICARPALNCKKSGPGGEVKMFCNPEDLLKSWELLIEDQARCSTSEGYRFDVVDMGRQNLSYYAQEIHQDVWAAFLLKDKSAFAKSSALFIDVLRDVDRLCETRSEYRFGDWLEAARKWGTTPEEADLYDKNATMLLTLWGPEDGPDINLDYSWREWSGMIREFYIPRWQMFHKMLADKLDKGENYSEEGLRMVCDREAWKANDFYKTLADWEIQWTNTPKRNWKKLDVGNGDEVAVASALLEKWQKGMLEAYRTKNTRPKAAGIEKEQKRMQGIMHEWNPKNINTNWIETEIDVTKSITSDGSFEVEFLYKKGNALAIEQVILLQDGVEISRDAHPAIAGSPNKQNRYNLQLGVLANGAKYVLKVRMRGEGGRNSHGQVLMKKCASK